MPLHDAVGINCKNGVIPENQGSGVKYMGSGVYLDACGCVCVVLLDMTTPPWWREKVMVYYHVSDIKAYRVSQVKS